MKKYIIAIDGGTTNTRVTLWQEPGVCVDTVKVEVGVRVTSMEGSNAALKAAVKDILEQLLQRNGIGPGYIATQKTAPLRQPQEDGSRHPFDQFIISKTPAGRWGEAEDLAGPAVFLASDASNFVNGHILYVDGGILAYIGKQP